MVKKRNRLAQLALSILFISALLSGCSPDTGQNGSQNTESAEAALQKEQTASSANQEQKSYTFADDTGKEIVIEKPQKVASLIGSYTDLWLEAGGKNSLTGSAHDAWTSFDLDLDESVQDLGDVKSINLEKLIALEPDLVIASAKNASQMELAQSLEEMGIPVAYFDVSDFDDYLRVFKVFCDLNDNEEAYQEKGEDQREAIETVIDQAPEEGPSVLYLRATGKGVSAKNSKDTVLGEMLADLNTTNVADGNSALEDLSMEAILQANPEKIFIVYQGSDDTKAKKSMEAYLNNSAWQDLDAVKNGEVYVMDQQLYNLKPNARWAEAYQNLSEILYGK